MGDMSYYKTIIDGRYKNPLGKTGKKGKGELKQWGANYSIEVMITFDDDVRGRSLLLKKVQDEWVFPGMLIEGGSDADAMLHIFFELGYTGKVPLPLGKLLGSVVVWDGRQTDDAWIESDVYHVHFTDMPSIATTKELRWMALPGSHEGMSTSNAQMLDEWWLVMLTN
jgi:hypothetical protein